jgi:cytochrome b561
MKNRAERAIVYASLVTSGGHYYTNLNHLRINKRRNMKRMRKRSGA